MLWAVVVGPIANPIALYLLHECAACVEAADLSLDILAQAVFCFVGPALARLHYFALSALHGSGAVNPSDRLKSLDQRGTVTFAS